MRSSGFVLSDLLPEINYRWLSTELILLNTIIIMQINDSKYKRILSKKSYRSMVITFPSRVIAKEGQNISTKITLFFANCQ
jgi:hypothetical protein